MFEIFSTVEGKTHAEGRRSSPAEAYRVFLACAKGAAAVGYDVVVELRGLTATVSCGTDEAKIRTDSKTNLDLLHAILFDVAQELGGRLPFGPSGGITTL